MPNGQPAPQKPEKIDPQKALDEHRIRLHNLKFEVQIQEAVIKKLEELAR